jgi:hypothetical protein
VLLTDEYVRAVLAVAQRVFTPHDCRATDKSYYPMIRFYVQLFFFAGLVGVATYQHGTYTTDIDDEAGEPTGREQHNYISDGVKRFFESDSIAQIQLVWGTVWNEVRK